MNKELRGRIKGYSIQVTSGLGLDDDYQAFLRGEVDRGPLGVTIYDNLYKGYSRPGTSAVVLDFLSGYEPWRKFEADYRAGRKKEYYWDDDGGLGVLISNE